MRTAVDRAYTEDMVHDWTRVEAGIVPAFHELTYSRAWESLPAYWRQVVAARA